MKLKHWLEEQPFTLSLSSGFFGFFAHAGFSKALEEQGLFPERYTGASAGAIVAGALAGGMPATELEKILVSIKLRDFFDPAPGLGILRGEKFERLLTKYFGNRFDQLKKPAHIATFNIFKRRTETFTSGDLAKAVRASAALPVMFQPVRIGMQLYCDGGILDKMALSSLPQGARVLSHCLPSDPVMGAYERLMPHKRLPPNLKAVVLNRLPVAGPHKLHVGPAIIESAYRQTKALLTN